MIALATSILASLAIGATPAGAELTTNEIGCAGSAVITTDDGEQVTVNAEDDTVSLPAGAREAVWQGSVATVTHDHSGQIEVAVGPTNIQVGSWSSPNAGNAPDANGTKKLPSALDNLPPGKYEVSGFHEGKEGRCEGRATIEVDGSIVGSPISAVSVVLAVVGLLLLLAFGLLGKPALAALGGLLFGLFGGLDLVFLKALGSGSILLVVLPILFLVVGLALGLARSRSTSTA
jgi:hypothetical protein